MTQMESRKNEEWQQVWLLVVLIIGIVIFAVSLILMPPPHLMFGGMGLGLFLIAVALVILKRLAPNLFLEDYWYKRINLRRSRSEIILFFEKNGFDLHSVDNRRDMGAILVSGVVVGTFNFCNPEVSHISLFPPFSKDKDLRERIRRIAKSI